MAKITRSAGNRATASDSAAQTGKKAALSLASAGNGPRANTAPGAKFTEEWRAQVGELVQRALDVLHDQTLEEVTGDEGNGPHAFQLIFQARRKLEEDASALAGRESDTILLSAWSMLMGARDMKGNNRVLPAMLEPAIAALEQAFDIASRNLPLPHAAEAIASPAIVSQAGESSSEDFALMASWEIDKIARLLHEQIPNEQEGMVHRTLLRRIMRLACIQMDALQSEASPEELEEAMNEGEGEGANHG